MLREYQQSAVDAIWAHLLSHPGQHALISAPTGSGKSIVLAKLCSDAIERWDARVVLATHRKELIEQNAAAIEKIAGQSVGVFSAGLRKRDVDPQILCCGIQSIYKRADEIGDRQLLIIDEVHLFPPDGEGIRAPLDLRALVGAPGADAGARRMVAVLKERLVTSERSLVWLRTCEAFGGDVGQAFAEALADALGVRVGGHTHVIGFWQSGLHSLAPGQRALWSREEGIRRGTASAPELGARTSPELSCTIHCLERKIPPGW